MSKKRLEDIIKDMELEKFIEEMKKEEQVFHNETLYTKLISIDVNPAILGITRISHYETDFGA